MQRAFRGFSVLLWLLECKERSSRKRLQALRFEFKQNNRSLDRNRSIVAELYEPSDAGQDVRRTIIDTFERPAL